MRYLEVVWEVEPIYRVRKTWSEIKIRAINKKVGETRPEMVDVVVSKEDMMRIEHKNQLVFFMSEA